MSPMCGNAPPREDEFHFEGPEKKLDISFARVQGQGLRLVPQSVWVEVLKDAKCSILHRESNDRFDAYLLSESSLFIFPDRMVAKTCGQTTLLKLVPHLFVLGELVGTRPTVLTYGHYRYRFPEEQEAPHRSFYSEREHLDTLFPGLGRAATLAGDEAFEADASARCWHFYAADLRGAPGLCTPAGNARLFDGFVPVEGIEALRASTEQVDDRSPESPPRVEANNMPISISHGLGIGGYETPPDDAAEAVMAGETVLEVAMEGISRNFTRHFFFDGIAQRADDSVKTCLASGIQALMPGVTLDPWNFEPCGFSLNGLCDNYYFTIHITPEPQMSFASFETNDPRYASDEFLAQLLATFEPQHAAVLVTARAATPSASACVPEVGDGVNGYRRVRANSDKFAPAMGTRCAVLEALPLAQ
ncbi:S-adenosylmethionine decarboxylase [Pavlovales sp. CCMP2436]|nr:S-adenosylmethionine decarboxylase [Pavlovales sp. CCMP2436]|mmetsp:Transcript_11238/g.28387  ORF Transcript_11238/g.28387 Transcript_11238/m.28387 type:complete len:418 (+) Transcript_11238:159-1412(+)